MEKESTRKRLFEYIFPSTPLSTHSKSIWRYLLPEKKLRKTAREKRIDMLKRVALVYVTSFLLSIIMLPVNMIVSADTPDDTIRNCVTFEQIADGSFSIPSSYGDLGSTAYKDAKHTAMKACFKSSSEYTKWLKQATNAVECTTDNGSIKFWPVPKELADSSHKLKDISTLDNSTLSKAYTAYDSTANKFNKIMTRQALAEITTDVFKTDEFDPTNAFVYGAIQYFTNAVNTVFTISARVLMGGFLAQSGLDLIYLILPATGNILASQASGASGAGGGGLGGAGGKGDGIGRIIKWNIVSEEAIEAQQGGAAATGRSGGPNAAGGSGSGFMSNKFFRYITLRGPLFLFVAVYLVLVATNLWEKLIAWTGSQVTSFLYSFL